ELQDEQWDPFFPSDMEDCRPMDFEVNETAEEQPCGLRASNLFGLDAEKNTRLHSLCGRGTRPYIPSINAHRQQVWCVNKSTLTTILGGANTHKDTIFMNLKSRSYTPYLRLHHDLHPHAPSAPGEPGLILDNPKVYKDLGWQGGPIPVWAEISKNQHLPSTFGTHFQYMGHYACEVVKPLSKEEWNMINRKTRMNVVDAMFEAQTGSARAYTAKWKYKEQHRFYPPDPWDEYSARLPYEHIQFEDIMRYLDESAAPPREVQELIKTDLHRALCGDSHDREHMYVTGLRCVKYDKAYLTESMKRESWASFHQRCSSKPKKAKQKPKRRYRRATSVRVTPEPPSLEREQWGSDVESVTVAPQTPSVMNFTPGPPRRQSRREVAKQPYQQITIDSSDDEPRVVPRTRRSGVPVTTPEPEPKREMSVDF
ncbi:hypothetical protein FRB99_000670, partial [Tulasnella sp. 403]